MNHFLPNPPAAPFGYHDQIHPSQSPMMAIGQAGLWVKGQAGRRKGGEGGRRNTLPHYLRRKLKEF